MTTSEFFVHHVSLKKIRAKIWIGRTESTLFNTRVYAKDMGRLFLRMWKKFEAGENPDHITLLG